MHQGVDSDINIADLRDIALNVSVCRSVIVGGDTNGDGSVTTLGHEYLIRNHMTSKKTGASKWGEHRQRRDGHGLSRIVVSRERGTR
jgi:hypothetical protein